MTSHLTRTISTTKLNPSTQTCFLDKEKKIVYTGVLELETGMSLEEKVVSI